MIKIMSPKYKLDLIKKIDSFLWSEYLTSDIIESYLLQWYEHNEWDWENFKIIRKPLGIDPYNTLCSMDDEMVLKVAIDLGIETPDFIPSIPTFRNEIKSSYINASLTFEKAFKQVVEHPDIAIGLVNSALESIIKEILKDERISTQVNANGTLYALTGEVLKVFNLYPSSNIPNEIKTIGSSMLAINQSIEKIRSEKTFFHGKANSDSVVDDTIYAYFVVNSVATIGLFLDSYYKKMFPIKKQNEDPIMDDFPF